MEEDNPPGLDSSRDPVSPSMFCGINQPGQVSSRQEQDSMSPDATSNITPTASLKSCDSFVSSCSEFLADSNFPERENANEGILDTYQKYLSSSSLSPVKIDVFSSVRPEYLQDINNAMVTYNTNNSKLKDVKIIGAGESTEGTEGGLDEHNHSFKSGKEETKVSYSYDIEINPNIWLPPEPEDMEDDVVGNVANLDEDDVHTDGTKWGQNPPLSRLCEDRSRKLKVEFQKTMALVMNGKFKNLVSRLLKLEGIVIAKDLGESWVDIVTSLSWEAALLVTIHTTGAEIVDPEGAVKVKCIATGLCSQSQLINALVFKKNAAHKHMPTKHKNPKLLLLEGMLGHRPSGLSSFNSMEQEKDNLKSIIETIEMCHPNVVLVENTVSRDVQESFLAKGITLVFDMKAHRLERIAQYADSKIFSSDGSLLSQKLKQCESFYFEKFVEEHGFVREGGKKPMKTLMYLEGCNRPLGFTILLKGAHYDELKKIKSVVHSAVAVAYHLILETSFLVDQRAMFSNIHSMEVDGLTKELLPTVGSSTSPNFSSLKDSLAETTLAMDLFVSEGSGETPSCEGTSGNFNMDMEQNSALPGFSSDINSDKKKSGQSKLVQDRIFDGINGYQPQTTDYEAVPIVLPGHFLARISSSLKEVMKDRFSLVSSASHQLFSTHFGCKESEPDVGNIYVMPLHTPYEESNNCDIEVKDCTDVGESPECESPISISSCSEVPVELCKAGDDNGEDQMEIEDDVNTVLDAQSILYLATSRRVLRRTVCKSHLWRVKYNNNFDMSLGRFLHDLLDQTHRCSTCGHLREAHVHNYVNRSGKITVRVKELSVESRLPGEAEGKLWMWAQCSRCESLNKNQGSTRRVVLSAAARGLSFGKFLDLNLSVHPAFDQLSYCGHSFQKDYLHFYGLGPMVTMFTYSPINIYTTCMPPPVLEFKNPIGQDCIKKEAESVLEKGRLLFSEVSNLLQNIGSDICNSISNPPGNLIGFVKEFSEVEEMLKQEKVDFEVKIRQIIDKNECLGQSAHELLNLNTLNQELMLESYVWDRRLQFLLSSDFKKVNSGGTHKATFKEVQLLQRKDDIADQRFEGRENTLLQAYDGSAAILIGRSQSNASLSPSNCDVAVNHGSNPDAEPEIKLDGISVNEIEHSVDLFQLAEHQRGGYAPEPSHQNSTIDSFLDAQANGGPTMVGLKVDGTTPEEYPTSTACRVPSESLLCQDSGTSLSPNLLMHDGNHQEHFRISELLHMGETIPKIEEQAPDTDSVANLHVNASEFGEASSMFSFKGQERGRPTLQKSTVSSLDDSPGLVWNSFSEICTEYKMDLQRGYSQKFEFIYNHTPKFLSPANQLFIEEEYRLHIPLGPADNVVSAYEGEPTSIIACALALLHEGLENGPRKEESDFNRATENAPSLDSDVSVASSYWSSNGSLESEEIHSRESVSSDESYTSFFDGSSLVKRENPHLEIHLGVRNLSGKEKYSVLCLYEKQFRALRSCCCPCELDYISSLSRCKNWDAKGGKSGSLFVKTLDDRFVIKQIQKTEFDSFLKFAPNYFNYTNQSLSSGNQTCLAKILGIYQVTIRQSRTGKDLKYNLVVMENLLFGRNITRLYDLKGAQYARYIKDEDGKGKVYLDKNFVEDMNISPLYIGGKIKHLLQRAVWNDTVFLNSINVMDYSLLVGVDMQRLELVCGIIDYLRQYTWDKQLETWVKASLVVPKNVTPTVVSPREYKKRFRKFMDLHFLTVPDHCCPEICVGSCKLCGDRIDFFSTEQSRADRIS